MNKLVKTNPILQKAQELREQNRAELVNLESFNKALNRKPAIVKTNNFANNTKYVPISHIQTMLDTMYFGLWQTKNFQYKVIANELVGSIDLWLWHPVIKDWLVRTGVAATQIRQSKGAKLTDIGAKIKNALEMDAAHLYADCVKSAAKTLGPAFGRDLNREFTDNYKAVLSNYVDSQSYTTESVDAQINTCKTTQELLVIWDSNPLFKQDAELGELFEQRKNELLNAGFGR
jgi:hypothetical protein